MPPRHYEQRTLFDVNNMSGRRKKRTVYEPSPEAREVSKQFVPILNRHIELHPAAIGGIKGVGLAEVARRHSGNQSFHCLDIKSAFPSVIESALIEVLSGFDFPDKQAVLDFVKEYCFDDEIDGLITGSPASAVLFNAYCGPMDMVLQDLAEKRGFTYTRLIDDIVLSSPEPRSLSFTRRARRDIREVIEAYRFDINHDKTSVCDLSDGPIIINGVQLNPDGSWALPTRYLRMVVKELKEARWSMSPEEARQLAGGYKGLLLSTHDETRAGGIQNASYYRAMRLIESILKKTNKRDVDWGYDNFIAVVAAAIRRNNRV